MSIEEKLNSPTYQDSDSVEYPQNEKEVSEFVKQFYKLNIPIELIGSGSKRKIGKPLQCAKILNLSKDVFQASKILFRSDFRFIKKGVLHLLYVQISLSAEISKISKLNN